MRKVGNRMRQGRSDDIRNGVTAASFGIAGAGAPSQEERSGLLWSEGDEKALDQLKTWQEAGILPLKIRLPKSGRPYRFSRLMTAQEALALDATFVHLPLPWFAAALGMLLTPIGVLAVRRFRRA